MHRSAKRTIVCVGAPISAGAPFAGSELGPAELRSAGWERRLASAGLNVRWPTIGAPIGRPDDFAPWLAAHAALCAQVVRDGDFPLVIGGDHSIAAATWRGVGRALGEAPGLLWIDAHLDAHTPATSQSGNLHGMPVAALLGHGDGILSRVSGPALQPSRLVLLAGHSYETPELELLQRLGVTIHLLGAVRKRGLATLVDEACRDFGEYSWGISLDVDALDPACAPGVSTPVPGGLAPEALLGALRGICRRPGCVALEIAEFNPRRDQAGRTRRLIEAIAQTAFADSPSGQT